MAHVSTEDAMKARNIDLISYLEAKGETFKKEETITVIRNMTVSSLKGINTPGIVVAKRAMERLALR